VCSVSGSGDGGACTSSCSSIAAHPSQTNPSDLERSGGKHREPPHDSLMRIQIGRDSLSLITHPRSSAVILISCDMLYGFCTVCLVFQLSRLMPVFERRRRRRRRQR